jgi:2-C-methyl-D-erythritol 2,4-cyclodiphosphate synthase
MSVRIGFGQDIHRFVSGRPLFLGGVSVNYPLGLDGHSDADVVLHAICDALLGALGRGDIGEIFPNTDLQYKGISSSVLLKKVAQLVTDEGYKIGNVDVSIIAEEPILKEYKPKMRFHIAYVLAIDETQVNIKAGTNEGLGAIGQKQGIAAYAVVSLSN